MDIQDSTIWPQELRLNAAKNALRVSFAGGFSASLPAELLRVLSPSAEVQGHSRAGRKLVSGQRLAVISGIEPVGNYAVRIVFGDGHSTGIYTWAYLYELGRGLDAFWATYVAELSAAGLSRDPR